MTGPPFAGLPCLKLVLNGRAGNRLSWADAEMRFTTVDERRRRAIVEATPFDAELTVTELQGPAQGPHFRLQLQSQRPRPLRIPKASGKLW